MSRYRLSIVVLGFLLAGRPLVAAEFFVSPTGTDRGNGSQKAPWSLGKALSHPGTVKPGDTIWLRGGKYAGVFTSYLTGTGVAPIKVRQYPGERATLDSGTVTPNVSSESGMYGLAVNGTYTWYMGFEVTNSNTTRTNPTAGSNPPNERNFGVGLFAPGNKIINMVIHDTAQGIGSWTPATDSEIYGNLIYYNGWDGPDRSHGHGIYIQNQAPSVKRVTNNIIFDQFDMGVHAYTTATSVDNINIEGNTAFNNGFILPGASGGAFLIGGGSTVVQRPSWISNYTYGPRGYGGSASNFGYDGGTANGIVTKNYFAEYFMLVKARGLSMTGNTFGGGISGFTSGDYPTNTYFAGKPTGTQVFLRPNQYEAGRANITIFNWDRNPSVNVDLSTVLAIGSQYEIRNAQNFYGPPVLSGTYAGGSIALPMSGLTPAAPVGVTTPPATGPGFNAFVVLTKADATRRRKVPDLPNETLPMRRILKPK